MGLRKKLPMHTWSHVGEHKKINQVKMTEGAMAFWQPFRGKKCNPSTKNNRREKCRRW